MIVLFLYLILVSFSYIMIKHLCLKAVGGAWTVGDRLFALIISAIPVVNIGTVISGVIDAYGSRINWGKPAKW